MPTLFSLFIFQLKKGHILDLECCSGVRPFNSISTKYPTHNAVSFHNTKSIDLNNLDGMIDHSVNLCCFNLSTSDLVYFYNDNFSHILDIVAPVKTRTVSFVLSPKGHGSSTGEIVQENWS